MAYDITKLPKYKQRVQELHDKYCLGISTELREWAENEAYSLFAISRPVRSGKNKRWCPYCGEDFIGKPDTCPHCGRKLTHSETYTCHGYGSEYSPSKGEWSFRNWSYIEELTTCEGWQIDRYYVADYEYRRGCKPRLAQFFVAWERWFNPDTNKEVLLGKYMGMYPSMRRIPWVTTYWDDTEVFAHWKNEYYTHWGGYDIGAHYSNVNSNLYPKTEVLPNYDGLMKTLCSYAPDNEFSEYLRALTTDNAITETLCKCYEPCYIKIYLEDPKRFAKHWRSIVLARRWHYNVGRTELQVRDYLDYLDNLVKLGRDTRSPKYICPCDFKKAHTEAVKIIRDREEREREKRRLQDNLEKLRRMENEKMAYTERMHGYFGIVLTSKHITAKPLMSVDEFMEEGTAMHHCVFANAYYNHSDCLILSARDKDGNRVETIEVNLKTYKVVQSRAKYNGTSEYHQEIMKMMKEQMGIIKAVREPKKKTNRTSVTNSMRAVN